MKAFRVFALGVSLAASLALAQRSVPRSELGKYEFGVAAGYSFYTTHNVSGSRGSADAGFNGGLSSSAWIGHNMYRRLGGELRYDFQWNEMKLKSAGTNVGFGGLAHALHYDLVMYTADIDKKVRPYVVVGGGVKLFQGTGEERAFQPLSTIAVLTHTHDLRPLLTFGGGVKWQTKSRMNVRLEVRDNVTPFPTDVITPMGDAKTSNWIHNIVALVGLSFVF